MCAHTQHVVLLHETRCIFVVSSRLPKPQWPLKIGGHGHFKGVLVLVIYHLVALIELLAAILRVITQERVCGSKGNTRTKNFELCQTRVEGKNESRIYIYLRFSFTQTLSEKNNHKQVLNLRPWFATNTKQRYLYRSQTRRATTFQSCPSGDTCSTCMSIPRPYLRGGLFIFAEYIWS